MKRLVALALVPLALAVRSGSAQVPLAGTGTVRGVVYDSLLGRPLAAARVIVVGTAVGVQTDERGRYRLDSVPAGRRIVAFSHPALDSIGLTSFAAPVTVRAGREDTVPLAVPSHTTYRHAACGGVRRLVDDTGIVFGAITNAETGERIPNARAAIHWITIGRDTLGRFTVGHAGAEVFTDSLGMYYLCTAPVEYLLTAQALAGPFSSGVVDFLVDARGIARRDLSVSLEPPPAPDSGPPRPDRGQATVIGTVRGERGGIVPGAVASLDDVADTVEADAEGAFALRELPSGSRMLMVRRVGYFAWRSPVELRNGDTTRVEAKLVQATMLDTIRVTAAPWMSAVLQEIEVRRRSGFGYAFGLSEIRQRPHLMSVFEGIPSVIVTGNPLRYTIWVRASLQLMASPANPGVQGGGVAGYCHPDIYIDSWPADEEQLQTLTPTQVVVVEVYPRPTAALARYEKSGCGVVLVWTAAAR